MLNVRDLPYSFSIVIERQYLSSDSLELRLDSLYFIHLIRQNVCVYEVRILENLSNALHRANEEIQLSVREWVIHPDLGRNSRLGFSQGVP